MAIEVITWVWNHSRAKKCARLVLLAIADNAGSDGRNAFPSNAELRRKCQLSERGVQNAVQELIHIGELVVGWNEGPGGCNSYAIVMRTPADPAPPQGLRPAESAGDTDTVETDDDDQNTPAESAPRSDCAPAELAGGELDATEQDPPEPPADPAPPQGLRPAESAGVTVINTSTHLPSGSTSSSPRKRAAAKGTRIPDDFALTPDMISWGLEKFKDVDGDYQTEKFIDYWRGVSGTRGVKTDWVATWRNWIRKASEDSTRATCGQGSNVVALNGSRPSTADLRAEQARNAAAEVAAEMRARGAS